MTREADKNDLSGILELYLHLHDTAVPEDSEELKRTWEAIINDPNHHLIIYEENGKPVSSCTCIIIPNLTRGVRPYAFVENVVTHKDYRGKGYARACLNQAIQIAEKENCYKVMLMTGSKDDNILRFYENSGFKSGDKTAFVRWINMPGK